MTQPRPKTARETPEPETPESPPGRRNELWEPGSGHPLNKRFLNLLQASDGSPTDAEAESFGPWVVVPADGGWAVYREWEAEGRRRLDMAPAGWFQNRWHALYFAAVLTPLFRDPLFHLGEERQREGYPLQTICGERGVKTVGWLYGHQPELAEAMHLAGGIARSPQALANLLEAAGPTTVGLALDLLGRRLLEQRREWQREVHRASQQVQAAEQPASREEAA